MKDKYRKGVGIFLINRSNKLWVGKRLDYKNRYWQMPQGGIDEHESPERAMRRELMEETGLKDSYNILGKTNNWLRYNLPNELIKVVWKGKYIGQEQIWFACRFLGDDKLININQFKEPEFCEWKWINPLDSTNLVVPFKRELYFSVINEFKKFFS